MPSGLPAQSLLDLEVRGAAGSGLLFQAVSTP